MHSEGYAVTLTNFLLTNNIFNDVVANGNSGGSASNFTFDEEMNVIFCFMSAYLVSLLSLLQDVISFWNVYFIFKIKKTNVRYFSYF